MSGPKVKTKKDESPVLPSAGDEALAKMRSELDEMKALYKARSDENARLLTLLEGDRKAPASAAPLPPAVRTRTVEEIQEIMADPEKFVAYVDEVSDLKAEAKLARFEKDKVDPLRNVGLSQLQRLAIKQAEREFEHFAELRDDVVKNLGKLPEEMRATAEGLEVAYKFALADHHKEILTKAIEVERERVISGGIDFADGSSSSSHEDEITPEMLLKNNVIDRGAYTLIMEKHGGPERWAQVIGRGKYANFHEYAKTLAPWLATKNDDDEEGGE